SRSAARGSTSSRAGWWASPTTSCRAARTCGAPRSEARAAARPGKIDGRVTRRLPPLPHAAVLEALQVRRHRVHRGAEGEEAQPRRRAARGPRPAVGQAHRPCRAGREPSLTHRAATVRLPDEDGPRMTELAPEL